MNINQSQHLHGFILFGTMSFLPSSKLLQTLNFGHGNNSTPPVANGDQKAGQKPLRPKSSIANLIQFVRNPVDTVGEAVENWYEGNTKEARMKQQILEDKKQILYLRLSNVGFQRLAHSFQRVGKANEMLDRLRLMPIGKRRRQPWTISKATMIGSLSSIRPTTMRHSWKPD